MRLPASFALLIGCGLLLPVASAPAAESMDFAKDVQPLLQKYCWDCHGDDAKKGDLNLDRFKTEADVVKERKVWDTVMFNLDNWLMPPAKKDQPTHEERAKLVQWIDAKVFPVDPANPDPGRVTIRRLNRTEYNNTMRDLVGLDLRPADSFPDDDSGYGFDNIGDVLAMPPVLVERYLLAASRVLDAAVVSAGSAPRKEKLAGLRADGGGGESTGDGYVLASQGEAFARHDFPAEAEYILRVKAHGQQAGPDVVKMSLRLDGKDLQTFEVKGSDSIPQTCEVRVKVPRGEHRVGGAFLNDYYQDGQDRNLIIDGIEVEGPIWTKDSPLPESHRRIFVHDAGTEGKEAATRKVIQTFANRAFRRPARKEEVDKLVGLATRVQSKGLPWEEAVKQALRACLTSPYFLYRIEWQPEPNNPQKVVELSDFALASRLSYFLWSSMPDDRLLSLAFKKELRPNLAEEVRRMIADPKARAMAENFAGQWLETRNLQLVRPNRKAYPAFDNRLRESMAGETEEFFMHLLRGNKSVLEFISADYTFVDERLARHYGMDAPKGGGFQKVALDPSKRRGLLTQASILTVTSDPTRTSPVKRGKWVLENILGTPPPPPPPNVPTLESSKQLTGTLRQRMEQHRANPACANCHAMLDPMGFGLENFDAIGAWRDKDGDAPVEAVGQLTSGQEFKNAIELTDIILRDKSQNFVKCLTGKLLTYALGRGVEYYDKPAIAEIMAKAKKDNYAFQSLIIAVAESVPFQKRRGDGVR